MHRKLYGCNQEVDIEKKNNACIAVYLTPLSGVWLNVFWAATVLPILWKAMAGLSIHTGHIPVGPEDVFYYVKISTNRG